VSRSLAPPRRRPKRVLAVRMLVARVAWLDGQPRWQEGRVIWQGPGGETSMSYDVQAEGLEDPILDNTS
jgi:hypothetical protein